MLKIAMRDLESGEKIEDMLDRSGRLTIRLWSGLVIGSCWCCPRTICDKPIPQYGNIID